MSVERAGLILAVCLLLASARPGGQEPADRPQTPPTFRAETRAIEVDAFVTDVNGHFVRGLAREDFEILEDDRPQEIGAFTMVDVPVESKQTHEKAAGIDVDSDVVTNATPGRIYVMLLDSPGLRLPETASVKLGSMFRLTHLAARRFVEEALGPNDVMAVIHVQDWRSDAQSFTSNKRLLIESIERLKPDLDFDEGTSPPLSYCDVPKLRNSYEALETISERLASMTGRRKAILWVNGRVPLAPADPDECGQDNSGNSGLLSSAQAGSLEFMRRDAMRAATRNNVVIYPIDPVGLVNDPRSPSASNESRAIKRLAALRGIAEETGGEAIVNTNNFSGGFERLVRSNSTYYLLAYRPPQDYRDGKFHTITVRVRRPGLSVRARKGYLAPTPGPPLEAKALLGVSPEGGAALRNPFPNNGLELALFLSPFKGAETNGSVVLGAELSGLLRDGAERRLEISYLDIDPQGFVRVGTQRSLSLEGLALSTSTQTVRFFDRLSLRPGRHEIRVAFRQPGGEIGSVTSYVDVPDFERSPLSMSGLVLASVATAGQLTLLSDAALRTRLSSDPTVKRHFVRSDTMTIYAEVYPEARTRLEDVRVTATISNPENKPVRTVSPERVATDSGRLGYTTRLGLADLAPGEYVLTMEAQVGRRKATRQVPFSVLSD